MSEQTYTKPFAAVVDGYEERGVRTGDTRAEAHFEALELWREDVECGWESPGSRTMTMYTAPVFCSGAPDDGDPGCPCGDSHADGDTMLSHEGAKRYQVQVLGD